MRVRTWARRGKTPVLEHSFNWKRLSLLLLASPAGVLLSDMVPGAMTAPRIVANLIALLATLPGRIVLLWDGAPIHRARMVSEFLARDEVRERLEVVAFPPYSPDLNPVELINSAIKRKGLGNFAAKNLEELKERANAAMKDFMQEPSRLRNCFEAALGRRFENCQVVTK